MMKSLMLKLLTILVLVNSSIFGFNGDDTETKEHIDKFFRSVVDGRGQFVIMDIKVKEHKEVKEIPGWRVYFVDIKIKMLKGLKEEVIAHEKVFTNGKYISKDFLEIESKASLKRKMSIDMKDDSFYNKEHLIYGDGSEKDKMVVFTDPLCPFCQEFMPEMIEDIKAHPGKIAVYYYHLPLPQIHPASPTIAKAMNVAKHKGVKDVELQVYKSKDFLLPEEKDAKKSLKSFNKALGTSIKLAEIKSSKIAKEVKEDKKWADKLMISGTPTIYLNGKKDDTRYKYKKILGL